MDIVSSGYFDTFANLFSKLTSSFACLSASSCFDPKATATSVMNSVYALMIYVYDKSNVALCLVEFHKN